MDEVVRASGLRNNCTFCGVFRRQALDRGAVLIGADCIATGHNVDDIAETVLMNLLRGDIARLGRCAAIVTGSRSREAGGAGEGAAGEASCAAGVCSSACGASAAAGASVCAGGGSACASGGGPACGGDASVCAGGTSAGGGGASASASACCGTAPASGSCASARGCPPVAGATCGAAASSPPVPRFRAVARCKPLKYMFEKEIVLYAHHRKLRYHATECLYSPQAYRGVARELVKDLEAVRPRALLDIVASGEAWLPRAGRGAGEAVGEEGEEEGEEELACGGGGAPTSSGGGHVDLSTHARVRSSCRRCGYMTSAGGPDGALAERTLCQACTLLAGLEAGTPRVGLASTRQARRMQESAARVQAARDGGGGGGIIA